MIYNDFHGLKLSRLGFGCMRFAKDPATGEIDQEKVNQMFKLAIAGGVNYFDTAYPYLDGKSEGAMAEALKDYPRESYYIADKFPGHSLPGPIDNIALFNLSLERSKAGYFDFYLFHNFNESTIKIYEDEAYHIIPDILKMKEEGKIRHLGFSYHGGTQLLERILTKYEGLFEFVQIQCNYLDWTLQNAKEKYDIITRHGLGVWIMEPVRGGKLANLPVEHSAKVHAATNISFTAQENMNENSMSADIEDMTDLADMADELGSFSPAGSAFSGLYPSDASYAFRFLQDLPNVKVILSGMNEVFQTADNLKTFEEHKPLTDAERDALLAIAEDMKVGVPCTSCRYCCAGCPMELDIPLLLSCYNSMKQAGGFTASMQMDGLSPEELPSACIACGQCTHACPQGIDVPTVLSELADMYAKAPKWAVAAKSRHDAIRRDLHME